MMLYLLKISELEYFLSYLILPYDFHLLYDTKNLGCLQGQCHQLIDCCFFQDYVCVEQIKPTTFIYVILLRLILLY